MKYAPQAGSSSAVGQEVVNHKHAGALGQIGLGHAHMVFHAVGVAEHAGLVYVAGDVAGLALFGKHNGDVVQRHGSGNSGGDAAGFHGEHDIGLLLTERIGKSLTHLDQQSGIQTVVQKHIHLYDIFADAYALFAHGLYQFLHCDVLLL